MSALIHNTLNDYWLWKEIRTKLGVSNPAYRYWRESHDLKLNNKYLFLQKATLPDRYRHVERELTDLSGFLPTCYASDILHADSRIFTHDRLRLYGRFEYKFVEAVKFVNLKRFFAEHGIRAKRGSILHLGRLKELEITPDTLFYRIDDDYGIVVYEC